MRVSNLMNTYECSPNTTSGVLSFTLPDQPGYKAIGIVGVQPSNAGVSMTRWQIPGDGTMRIELRSANTVSNGTLLTQVLYVRNDLQ